MGMSLEVLQSSLNFNSHKITYKEFFGCLGTGFVTFGDLFFFEFLTPFILGGCNFLNPNPFLMIFSASKTPIRRVQILFEH
jgi:hypothetical protein